MQLVCLLGQWTIGIVSFQCCFSSKRYNGFAVSAKLDMKHRKHDNDPKTSRSSFSVVGEGSSLITVTFCCDL